MPGVSQIVFVAQHLRSHDVAGKRILDVGSANFNGSIKPVALSHSPAEYVGIDIQPGKDVDLVLAAHEIVQKFGESSFDIIFCLEMLEHAPLWKESISNMKRALKPGGLLFVTTRSLGFPLHGFPSDFWRFTTGDFEVAFADMTIRVLQTDPGDPGVLLFAEKPTSFSERDLSYLSVHSMVTGTRMTSLPNNYTVLPYFRRLRLRNVVKTLFHAGTRALSRMANTVFALKS